VFDFTTKLTWQRAHDANEYDWQAAKKYCQALVLAGGGWRLPTLRELFSIVDFSQSKPAIDKTVFAAFTTQSFWSATTYLRYPSYAWYVYFGSGTTDGSGMPNSMSVRCVR